MKRLSILVTCPCGRQYHPWRPKSLYCSPECTRRYEVTPFRQRWPQPDTSQEQQGVSSSAEADRWFREIALPDWNQSFEAWSAEVQEFERRVGALEDVRRVCEQVQAEIGEAGG